MKKVLITTILSLFILLTTLATANAQESELRLTQKKMSVSATSAVLVRTAQTPEKVKIKMLVPMRDSVCTRHATRMVTATDSLRCGSRVVTRRSNCRRQCVRTSSCASGSPHCGQRCLEYATRCDIRQVRVANTCTYPQSYCVERDVVVTGRKEDQVTIKFKNLPSLREGEEERFILRARQSSIDGSNVKFDLVAERSLEDYIIKVRDFLGDVITVKR